MTGFGIDPDALDGAIKKLEDIRDESMLHSIAQVAEGDFAAELTAKDGYTTKAAEAINKRGVDERGSLQMAIRELTAKLDAYQATLEEYRRIDEAASAGGNRTHGDA
ncbi:hypothetical protein [Saccharopolyspora pogona]|uniref:hypothetical protein n=1 Tax=Saccharopolyspora pogona TaxID=333966 RepID=UPI0016871461|nr:hypothetical protein [Saccharopolyspora pogona]